LLDNITQSDRPRAYLNYLFFDENMNFVPALSGAFQANGHGSWQQIGTTSPMEITANGYLAVYLSNSTQIAGPTENSTVYFDQAVLRFTRGRLKEEQHYYPHGLPMAAQGSTAVGYVANRHKYQGNEYKTELGLNWMDFHNRQYDPQIGRFLSVDPLADDDQEEWSPYAAMGNNPAMMVDPLGLKGEDMQTPANSFVASPIYGGWGKREYNPGAAIDAFTAINAALAEGAHDLGIRSVYYDAMGMFKGVGTGLTAGNDLSKAGGYETTGKNSAGEFEITWHKGGNKPGFFGKLLGDVKNGAAQAWTWAKGIKFHFSLEGVVTFGTQIGAEVTVGGKKVGFDANAGSAEYLQGKVDINGAEGQAVTVSGNYYGKDNIIVMRHGIEGGIAVVSGGVENQYNLNYMTRKAIDESIKASASAGLGGPAGVNVEKVYPIGPQSQPVINTSGIHFEGTGKLKLLIGLEIKARIGFTHD
jgi:RHS repeat-associated protein